MVDLFEQFFCDVRSYLYILPRHMSWQNVTTVPIQLPFSLVTQMAVLFAPIHLYRNIMAISFSFHLDPPKNVFQLGLTSLI